MPTQYRWHKTVTYGPRTRVIRGMTKAEVEQKARAQLVIWQRQADKQREKDLAEIARLAEQDQLRALEAQANNNTHEAQARLTALGELLRRGLDGGKRFRWDDLKRHQQYPPFQFGEYPPSYEAVAQVLGVPTKSAFEGIFASRRTIREELEGRAQVVYQAAVAAYETRKAEAWKAYQEKRSAFERAWDEYNRSIDDQRARFQNGDPEAAKICLQHILAGLNLPEDYGQDFDVAFDAGSGTAVVNLQLPTLDEFPRISGYKFVKGRKASDPIEMKQKDFEALYDSVIYQIALLTMHRVFRDATSEALQAIVFNGWVTGIDRKTGNDFTSCILSVRATRPAFQALNLERVDPKECVRNFKGLVAGPLAQLAPVKPILDLNREDSRFIESREVLANLGTGDNLAEMEWEDFEHLVRELFAKVFGEDGAEVRVTQASRDRGVDAIAFDPDPIRGGKFVIQAKRYNNVVPVSAVRDLYGTMINEGAAKGILVTTSHFGNDSREFAKDKPITLIDGANLVHMFQEYGYEVRIEVK